ncbi:cell adhesion molecule 1-like isoform X1 [Anneissia japonica]|uniref:cell adhesion molecule 1-like isoform X1 n=1 Tax=Anneissia japonica TaxID=1529436 RepID=UPI001425A831|nr:cell adhesion molecule 1-like isoform X1 [Anneissia japonica]XP_033099028.1 cell adhesion molecule 1-like isoform X1 [Anneissia japonica]
MDLVLWNVYADRFSVEGDDSQLTLVINNTTRSDDGTYMCDVTVLNDPPSPASDTVTISVASFDLIFDISINTVVEGEPITFVCSVNSKPDPVVILYKDETPISRETTTNLTYNIDNVVRSDRGNYKCEASNIVGSDTSQVQRLDVQDIPEFDLADEVTVGHEEQ